jgi:hypothetical protein
MNTVTRRVQYVTAETVPTSQYARANTFLEPHDICTKLFLIAVNEGAELALTSPPPHRLFTKCSGVDGDHVGR